MKWVYTHVHTSTHIHNTQYIYTHNTHIYIYARTHNTFTHTHVYTHVTHRYIHSQTCISIPTCIYIHTQMYTCIHIYMYRNTCMCEHIATYMYTHIHAHTCACIHPHTWMWKVEISTQGCHAFPFFLWSQTPGARPLPFRKQLLADPRAYPQGPWCIQEASNYTPHCASKCLPPGGLAEPPLFCRPPPALQGLGAVGPFV